MTWGVQNTEAEAHAQLDYALKERGVTFVDTAEMYPDRGAPWGFRQDHQNFDQDFHPGQGHPSSGGKEVRVQPSG